MLAGLELLLLLCARAVCAEPRHTGLSTVSSCSDGVTLAF